VDKFFGKEISSAYGITGCYVKLDFHELAFTGFIRTGMAET
jgi:hypothetical protein